MCIIISTHLLINVHSYCCYSPGTLQSDPSSCGIYHLSRYDENVTKTPKHVFGSVQVSVSRNMFSPFQLTFYGLFWQTHSTTGSWPTRVVYSDPVNMIHLHVAVTEMTNVSAARPLQRRTDRRGVSLQHGHVLNKSCGRVDEVIKNGDDMSKHHDGGKKKDVVGCKSSALLLWWYKFIMFVTSGGWCF